MSRPMLEVKNLFKIYQNAKYISARDISFSVRGGQIFGFLGVNGAGKSTTIKCITGIIPFTAGKIEICGHDIVRDSYKAKCSFGFVPDNHAVYDKLTGFEYVNYLANLYKVPLKEREETFNKLTKIFNMENAVNNQIASYSHGMKQKISIIGALIHQPKVWILDEPMVGLDPQSIYEVKNYMKEYAKMGNCVLFSSHNLDTVENLCDSALIVHGGKVLEHIDLGEYKKSGKNLEKEFMALTSAAKERYNKERAELAKAEAILAQAHGKAKANKMMQRRIRDEVMSEIARVKV